MQKIGHNESFAYFRNLMKGSWNNSFFIARSLRKQRVHAQVLTDGSNIISNAKSGQGIVRIATISIALAMIVNIITIAVVDGFQQEVSDKVIGFGSHITIQEGGESRITETKPLKVDPELVQLLSNTNGVTSVQPVAYKPALLRSSSDADQREIMGVLLKGVDKSYDWTFFKTYLKEGKIPSFKDPASIEIMVSRQMARDLHYKLHDTITALFVGQQPIQRQFNIVGIYETGFEESDKQLAFASLRQVQDLNDWGIKAEIMVEDTLALGQLLLRAEVKGGNGHFRFDWGEGFDKYGGKLICPTKDTTIRLIVADYFQFMDEPVNGKVPGYGETTIADTAYLEIKVSGNKEAMCSYTVNDEKMITKNYLDQTGYRFSIDAGPKKLTFDSYPGNGSSVNYIAGYELSVESFEHLDELTKDVKRSLFMIPKNLENIEVINIKQSKPELFAWLDFLDINMIIIISLMILIGIINMGSSLLVMILTRSNLIGILKSMGATNQQIRQIFLIQTGKLMLRGMLWGNLIGFGFCIVQKTFNILPLDAEVYYLNSVPISFSWFTFFMLNIVTILVCLAAMILPSMVVSRISPARAVKFS